MKASTHWLVAGFLAISMVACGGGNPDDDGGGNNNPTFYTVSTSAGSGGSISPSSASVESGKTTSFSVTASSGYSIDSVSGCGGSLSGSTYTTGAITGNCTVSASFSQNNQAPTANAGTDQTVDEQTQVTLSGSGTDSDGTIASYQWSQTAGTSVTLNNPNSATASFTAPTTLAVNPLTFELTVTDDDGATTSDTVVVSITPVNAVPIVDAGENQSLVEGSEVSLNAAATDSDGSIESYSWVQTAGTTVSLTNADTATATFTAPMVTSTGETLTFEITVTDNEGAVATDTVNIQVTDTPMVITDKLNDTGITTCSDESTNGLTCPVTGFEGQDGEYGRDVTHNDDADGNKGFSFTKLDANGNDLPASASDWSCVKDNVTGLIWEVKTNDGGLRDKDNTYTWYNSDANTNGGYAGYSNGGSCPDSGNCDTEKYVASVNAAGLCGANDWRMPSKEQLRSIVNYATINPAIDIDYFPHTQSDWYWAASPYAYGSYYAWSWSVNFNVGNDDGHNFKDASVYVRLVRTIEERSTINDQ